MRLLGKDAELEGTSRGHGGQRRELLEDNTELGSRTRDPVGRLGNKRAKEGWEQGAVAEQRLKSHHSCEC